MSDTRAEKKTKWTVTVPLFCTMKAISSPATIAKATNRAVSGPSRLSFAAGAGGGVVAAEGAVVPCVGRFSVLMAPLPAVIDSTAALAGVSGARDHLGITVEDVARAHPAAGSGSEGDRRPSAAEIQQRLRDERATPLGECGEEPDPRFTFANERTFLAWSRTALALIAAGLAAAQLLHFGVGGVRFIIAIPLIVLGAVAALNSYRQWEGNERRLRLQLPLSYSPVGKLVAIGITVIGVVAGILVIVDLIVS